VPRAEGERGEVMSVRSGLRIGVIGVGVMGERHARVYSTLPAVATVGVYDADVQRARRVAAKYGARAFASLDTLIGWADAISIVTPTPSHLDLSLRCMQRGVHVLVEKPLAESIAQAETIVRAAQEYGCIVQVGHIERFNPTVGQLRLIPQALQPLAVTIRRMSPFDPRNTTVDVIFDLMIHDLDLALYLFGHDITDAQAFGLSTRTDDTDHAVAHLTFRNGPLVTIVASRVTEQKVRHVEIVADGSYIEADLLNKRISIHRSTTPQYMTTTDMMTYRQESFIEQIHVPPVEPLALELDHFLTCVRTGDRPMVSAEEGLRAVTYATKVRDLTRARARHPLATALPLATAEEVQQWAP
jgi:predicted dehydrogenase